MLVICRDGILRVREHAMHGPKKHRYYDLPIRSYQKFYPNAFLKKLPHAFILEEGITVREYFANFAPYADLMEGLCRMDFQAFYEESQKTTIGEDHHKLSHILVTGYLIIKPVPAFDRSAFDRAVENEEEAAGPLRPFRTGKKLITDKIEFQREWSSSCMLDQEVFDETAGFSYDCVSVDYSPVSEWAHLPIRISEKVILRDEIGIYTGYLSIEEPILNPNHPWMKKSGDRQNHLEIEVIDTPNLFDLFEATFDQWGFSYSPAQRDEDMAVIASRVEEVKAHLAGDEKANQRRSEDVDDGATHQREEMDVIVEIMSSDPAGRVLSADEDYD